MSDGAPTRLYYAGPYCPVCGSQMVKRVPDPDKGQTFESFYGCRNFAAGCKGTLPLDWEARREQSFVHVREIWRYG